MDARDARVASGQSRPFTTSGVGALDDGADGRFGEKPDKAVGRQERDQESAETVGAVVEEFL